MADNEIVQKFTWDLSDISAVERRLETFVKKYDSNIAKAEVAAIKLSNSGKILRGSLNTIDNAGNKAIITLKALAAAKAKISVVGVEKGGNVNAEEKELKEKQERAYQREINHLIRMEEKRIESETKSRQRSVAQYKKYLRDMDLIYQRQFDRLLKHEESIANLKERFAISERERQKRNADALALDTAKHNNRRVTSNRLTNDKIRLDDAKHANKQYTNYQTNLGKTINIEAKSRAALLSINAKSQAQQLASQTKHNNALIQNAQKLQNQLALIAARQANKTNKPPKAIEDSIFGSGLFRQASTIATGILISQALLKVNDAFQQSIDAAAQFQIKISEIRTISQKAQLSTEQWTQKVRALSDAFGSSAFDTAEGVYQALSNQTAKSGEVTEFMTAAMKFAAASVTSTENAVNLLSSALNSYNLRTTDATKVSGILFKLIDLGRVRADEIANSLGTVTAIANKVGVGLEDVSGAVAVMTQQGVTAANAMTYLRNIFNTLLKPSKEMQKTLDGWGVASGELAIKTFGFVGVLERMNKIVERGGLGELAEDLNNIRSITGTALLTGDANLAKFKDSLEQFKSASSNYANAVKIAFESPGKQLEIEFNRIKNLFLFDFGKPVVDNVARINREFVSLTSVVSQTTKAVVALTAAGAAFSAVRLPAALKSIGAIALANPLAALAAGVAGGAVFGASQAETFATQFRRVREEAKLLATELNEITRQRFEREEKLLQDSITKQVQIMFGSIADIRKKYTDLSDGLQETYKELNRSLETSSERFFDNFGDGIKVISDRIKEMESDVKRIETASRGIVTKVGVRRFEESLTDATGEKRSRLEAARAMSLQTLAFNKFNEATNLFSEKKYEDAKALREEAYGLLDQAEELAARSRKSNNGEFNSEAQRKKREDALAKTLRDKSKELGITADLTKQGQKLADVEKYEVKRIRNRVSDSRNSKGFSTRYGTTTTTTDETDKYRDLQKTLEEYNKVKGIKIKNDSLETSAMENKLRLMQREKELTKQQIEADKLTQANLINTKRRLTEYFNAATKNVSVKSEDKDLTAKLIAIQNVRSSLESAEIQKSPITSFAEGLDIVKTLNQEEAAIRGVVEAKKTQMKLDAAANGAKRIQVSLEEEAAKRITEREQKERDFNDVAAQAIKIAKELDIAGTKPLIGLFDRGDRQSQVEAVKRLKTIVDKEKERLSSEYKKVSSRGGPLAAYDADALAIKIRALDASNIKTIVTQADTAAKSLVEAKNKVDAIEPKLQILRDELKTTSDLFRQTFGEIEEITEQSAKRQIEGIKDVFKTFREEIGGYKQFYESINKTLPQNAIPKVGGSVKGSTSANTTTSFGDINITVQGGDTSQATIKEIARGLRREVIRFGTPLA